MENSAVKQKKRTGPGRAAPGSRWERFKRQLPYQLMIWPGMVFLIIFAYIPIAGLVIAFQDYSLWG